MNDIHTLVKIVTETSIIVYKKTMLIGGTFQRNHEWLKTFAQHSSVAFILCPPPKVNVM